MAVTWSKLAFENDVITTSLLTTRGDLIRRGAAAPERYGLVVPASPTINYLGVANGEVDPAWKSASSNPGAAAQLLQSNASGQLQLVGLIAGYVRPAADSTTALQLQNAAGTAILTVDTVNGFVGINTGAAAPIAPLEIVRETDTNTLATAFRLTRRINGTPAAGLGTAYAVTLENSAGVDYSASRYGTTWIDPTAGSELVVMRFYVAGAGVTASSAGAIRASIYGNGNFGINTESFGTNAAKVVAITNGTAPTTSPANVTQLWGDDLSAGDAGLHIRSETGAIYKFGSYAVLPGGLRLPVATKAANYTLTATDNVVVFTATATATLPAATGSGQTYRIICRAGTLTIDGNGAETVKGALTQTIYAGDDLIVTDTATGVYE